MARWANWRGPHHHSGRQLTGAEVIGARRGPPPSARDLRSADGLPTQVMVCPVNAGDTCLAGALVLLTRSP
jgi:hypothetical protein